ncbi:MAG: YdeI/OmpD-associated family protein, partial [Candidatus Limnocylindrales bacterium]
SDAETDRFRANEAAWADWERRPPSYRKAGTHWVTDAKQTATRERRLATLIDDHAAGRKPRALTPPGER